VPVADALRDPRVVRVVLRDFVLFVLVVVRVVFVLVVRVGR
jgi:hypothetical protein